MEGTATLLQGRGYAIQISTSRPTAGPYTPAGWRRSARAMAEGRIDWLRIAVERSRWDESGASSTWWWGLTHPAAAEVDLSAEFGLRSPFNEAEFIGLCIEGAEMSGLAQGLLLPARPPDLFATRTPLEAELELRGLSLGPRALELYARGSGWGLWLTEGHLAGLGGRETVRRGAPVARVIERPAGLWLELTDSPWDVPDEALRRLERFLAPIIPSPQQAAAADSPSQPEPSVIETVTPPDDYPDYEGPPTGFEWALGSEDSLVVNVHLARRPSQEEAAALERTVAAWYIAGSEGAYPPGPFHDIGGPSWDDTVARWSVDIGNSDTEAAVEDLMCRLAGWSARWDCPIAIVRLGLEEP